MGDTMSQVAKFDILDEIFDESIFDIEGDYMASINILMNSDKSVTAHFKKKRYILMTAVDPMDSGTITGAGTYDKGTVVIVEAIPTEDYEFDHWSGDIN